MRIYLTYCSAEKNSSLKCSGKKATPDILYTGDRIQRFMWECKKKKVKWAIFSDKYGVWCPKIKHPWYDKHPDEVTFGKFKELLKDFYTKLRDFKEIYFYSPKGRPLHCLYRILLRETKLRNKITLFTDLRDIV